MKDLKEIVVYPNQWAIAEFEEREQPFTVLRGPHTEQRGEKSVKHGMETHYFTASKAQAQAFVLANSWNGH